MNKIQVVMPVHNRPRLTRQTIESLFKNTQERFLLTVIDDASDLETKRELNDLAEQYPFKLVTEPIGHGCAVARNTGVAVSPPSEYYYFTDNDMYFKTGWLVTLLEATELFNNIGVIGADNHPSHTVQKKEQRNGIKLGYCVQQVGYSMLVPSDVYREVGGFKHFQAHVYGYEDSEFCDAIRGSGRKLAHLMDRKVLHCGLTKTDGSKALGYNYFVKQETPEGVIKE